ncbi:MAG TPA: MBL fold metallo-hydrolase [Fimbriimonadaceae bacterium]|nr:MBL fold metallo-hydrolase [Fimbriimonadaceae bacterium]
MPEAVVLGSGTSNGVPMLGVEYAPEYLANPKNWRTRCSIILLGPEGNVLVDCAPELRLQMAREGLLRIDQVIITHTHADHVMGMDDLRSICMKTRRPMPIYADEASQRDIRRIFPYAFLNDPPAGIEVPRFELHEPGREISLCGMEIQILRVMHGPKTQVLALRVGGFAYVTDVNYIPPEEMDRLRGLDTLILDAVRYKPHPNHYHFDAAVEVARELGAKMTYFTHLSSDYDHDKTNATLPANIQLAYDGLRIAI